MKIRVLTITAVLTITCSAFAQKDTSARIATWNLEGFNPISNAKADRIAQGIVALDAEVVAVQEVNPNSTVKRVVETANSLGGEYEEPVFLTQTAKQNVAIIFKKGVSVTNPRFVPGSNLGNNGLRKALVVDVKVGKFDFTMIVVHLKSGRSNSSRSTRTKQCKKIADFIKTSTSTSEKDVLLVGDFNMIPGEDDENFSALSPKHYLTFLSTHKVYARATNVNGNFLDGFAVSRKKMTEYIGGSVRVYPLHRAYRKTVTWYAKNVSDHFPIVVRFDVTKDRD